MKPEDLLIADDRGKKVAGLRTVTCEFHTHLAAFEERPGIEAVVHGHPPVATALTIAGIDFTVPVVPEIVMGLIAIPTAPYATPGSAEGAEVTRCLIRDYDAILIDRHGSVTVGADPFSAYLKLEKIEHTAKVLHSAYALGRVRTLAPEQVAKLMALHAIPDRPNPPYPFPIPESGEAAPQS